MLGNGPIITVEKRLTISFVTAVVTLMLIPLQMWAYAQGEPVTLAEGEEFEGLVVKQIDQDEETVTVDVTNCWGPACEFGTVSDNVLEIGDRIPFKCDSDAILMEIEPSTPKAVFTIEKAHEGQCMVLGPPGQSDGSNDGKATVKYDGGSMDVKASLTNGSVNEISVDADFTSIVISVSTEDKDGEFTITLPRELIDSRADGQDDTFIVLVDGDEIDAEETETTQTERTLKIVVFGGTEDIEIIGTQVIPEFGILAALALGAAMGAIVLLRLVRPLPVI